MKTMFLNRMFMNIAAAVRDGGTYYVSAEEAEKLKDLLTVFSVLAIIGAVLVVALITVYVIKKIKEKGGEETK